MTSCLSKEDCAIVIIHGRCSTEILDHNLCTILTAAAQLVTSSDGIVLLRCCRCLCMEIFWYTSVGVQAFWDAWSFCSWLCCMIFNQFSLLARKRSAEKSFNNDSAWEMYHRNSLSSQLVLHSNCSATSQRFSKSSMSDVGQRIQKNDRSITSPRFRYYFIFPSRLVGDSHGLFSQFTAMRHSKRPQSLK